MAIVEISALRNGLTLWIQQTAARPISTLNRFQLESERYVNVKNYLVR